MKTLGIFAVIVVALTMMVGTATAGHGNEVRGAGKAPLYDSGPFTCHLGATSTGGPTFGFAVMNINKHGDLIVQVSVKGGTPNSVYDIWVNQDPDSTCPLGSPTAPGALTTDDNGNGNAHVKLDAHPNATDFWISAVGGGQVLRSTSVGLD